MNNETKATFTAAQVIDMIQDGYISPDGRLPEEEQIIDALNARIEQESRLAVEESRRG